ncbi:heme NO-binding domain-containing protein [Prosthecobacter sp.]|uniref:heme NO-binding domain-containing protein n=1 Tax=Prosthecobacter sp. TaxID=1965333 RepID=UPI0037C51F16
MVNSAIMDLLVANHGEATWQKVKTKAGVEDEMFISTEAYPDDITYKLVGAASEVLDRPAGEILNQFGRWWVLDTARNSYGHLLRFGGRTLGEFLINLPNFHTRVVMMFPALQPPMFECTELGPAELRLHYRSHRRGLSAFVIGVLEGLGVMFEVVVTITHEERLDEGADHDVFHIAWIEAKT